MKFSETLQVWRTHAEMLLVGPMTPDVRHNMYVDMRAASVHSLIATILNFLPLILRRAGASTEQVAYYHAVTALGLLTTGLSIGLMRRWGMRRVALVAWLVGRGAFVFTAVATNATGLLVVFTIFWLLESWPSPAYVQAMQTIYPAHQRGKIMATVRVALVGITLALTPVAGWILDHYGYQALLPLAALSGMGSALIFYPVLRQVPDTLSASTRAVLSPWQILRGDHRMPFYLAGVLLFGLGALISAPLYPAIQVDQLNLSYSLAGVLGLVQSVFWFLGYLFGGRILDRLGGIRTLQIVFTINAMVMLPYIWATEGWMLLPSFIATGLVTAGADLAAMYSVIHLAGPERVPDYTALSSIATGFRGLLGPFIGSWLVQIGWPFWAVFALSAALTLAGAASLILVGRAKSPVWEAGHA